MQKTKWHILSTRPLPSILLAEGASNGIAIDVQSFIETYPIEDEGTLQKIKSCTDQKHTVIVTSMNAVEAVSTFINAPVNWTVYCIGNTTRQLIEQQWEGATIAGMAEYGEALADIVVKAGVQRALFFCGTIRRDVLPQKIKDAGIQLEEVTVYKTIETPMGISKSYDAVLFYSPSAVNSFFSVNNDSAETVFFAIGKTTAEALQKHTSNPIIIADATGKKDLVQKAIGYFSTKQ